MISTYKLNYVDPRLAAVQQGPGSHHQHGASSGSGSMHQRSSSDPTITPSRIGLQFEPSPERHQQRGQAGGGSAGQQHAQGSSRLGPPGQTPSGAAALQQHQQLSQHRHGHSRPPIVPTAAAGPSQQQGQGQGQGLGRVGSGPPALRDAQLPCFPGRGAGAVSAGAVSKSSGNPLLRSENSNSSLGKRQQRPTQQQHSPPQMPAPPQPRHPHMLHASAPSSPFKQYQQQQDFSLSQQYQQQQQQQQLQNGTYPQQYQQQQYQQQQQQQVMQGPPYSQQHHQLYQQQPQNHTYPHHYNQQQQPASQHMQQHQHRRNAPASAPAARRDDMHYHGQQYPGPSAGSYQGAGGAPAGASAPGGQLRGQPGHPGQGPAPAAGRGVPRTASMDEALAVAMQAEEVEARSASNAKLAQEQDDFFYQQELAKWEQQGGTGLLFPDTGRMGDYDSAMAERLSRVPSMKITPRVNSLILPPPEPTLNDDRERLRLRLEQYGLTERQVKGDGACQFRSLSDQLYGHPEEYARVRAQVVAHLQENPQRYAPFVPSDYKEYCKEMSKPGTWGDHVTLQAAADLYGTRITVLTSYADNCVLSIEPAQKLTERTLWLSFWAEVHYNSVYPSSEPPPPDDCSRPQHHPGGTKVLGSKFLGRLLG